MKGKKIITLKGLMRASLDRKSVFVPNLRCFAKPTPAAWAQNFQGRLLHRLFEAGMYIYKKETPKCQTKKTK